MRNIFASLILLIFLQSYALAADFKAEQFFLKNGLQVIVINNSKVPAVSHMVWYRVGAIDEPRGKSGLAHFLEHMMFKGTKKFSDGQFSSMIAKAGGNDNAFTSNDYTAYYQNISRNKLNLAMELEADRMQNLIMKKEDAATEIQVILEERRSRTDNDPMALLGEQMRKALFLNEPYGTPLIGWSEEIAALTHEDAIEFYKQHYMPNNAILIVSGDITKDELLPLAEKYYGKIKPGKAPKRLHLQEPEHNAQRQVILRHREVKKPQWVRYYLAPSASDKENSKLNYALSILSYILGESDASRLYKKLILDKNIASSVGSYYDNLSLGSSYFGFSVTPNSDNNLTDIEQSIEEEISDIIKNGVTQDQLNRAKQNIISSLIYTHEDLKTLAYVYGQVVASGLDIEFVNNWDKNIANVTNDDIKQAALYVFKPEKSVTGNLYPLKQDKEK